MSVVVCCPCGNPIDVANLDLVVSLTCPECHREFELDLENGSQQRKRAILTVIEGTHWVGKKFLVPVEADLAVGRALGNWLCLEDDRVSNIHCKLRLSARGDVLLEDCKSMNGTWVNEQRVAKVLLKHGQPFRVGPFQFQLAICDAADLVQVDTAEPEEFADSGLLPTMRAVGQTQSLGARIASHRFVFSRCLLIASAWLLAIYHMLALPDRLGSGWTRSRCGVLSLCFAAGMTVLSRKVTLADRTLRYAPIAIFVLLAIVDLVLMLTTPAIGLLLVAAAMSLMLVRAPHATSAILAASTGLIGGLVILISVFVRWLA